MPPTTTPFRALRAVTRLQPHASRSTQYISRHFLPPQTLSAPSFLRPFSCIPRLFHPDSSGRPLYESSSPSAPDPNLPPREQQPAYEMTFTCTPCSTRSTHRISKQGYHHGSVLVTCPECKNRHIISDHLNIFGDKSMTIEDLMRDKGELVKKGTLSENGDVEFWDDGTQTLREKGDGGEREQGKIE